MKLTSETYMHLQCADEQEMKVMIATCRQNGLKPFNNNRRLYGYETASWILVCASLGTYQQVIEGSSIPQWNGRAVDFIRDNSPAVANEFADDFHATPDECIAEHFKS